MKFTFGHIHPKMILKMSKEHMVINIKLSENKQIAKLCEGCLWEESLAPFFD